MKRKHRIVAYGRGQFPSDMLRYDRGTVIQGPVSHEALNNPRVPRSEHWQYYVIECEDRPTVARWNSFLWSVVELERKR